MMINRRKVLTSLLAAGAFMERNSIAQASTGQDSAPSQPNNAHREPGNNPALADTLFKETEKDRFYRPGLHFTPPEGFMNDPNGLIFDGTYYHLYYQYNPFTPYAGHVHWGHAVSTDLYTWHNMPVAIQETASGEAYSGCVVMDHDNKSGLFPPWTKDNPEPGALRSTMQRAADALDSTLHEAVKSPVAPAVRDTLDILPVSTRPVPDFLQYLAPTENTILGVPTALSPVSMGSKLPLVAGGLVAIYTRATPQRQTQHIAWSPDGGEHFIDYDGNPVLDIGHNSFRDPKVLWHEPSGKWVMVVVRARDHKVSFYGSFDLRRWMHLSDFGPAGLFGVDYECPGLIELGVEAEDSNRRETRWVLFVSVNLGGPQGGSTTQYFVGHFDGERFTPEDTVVGLTDFAKDSYALQTYANMPGEAEVYLAWLNNWQYCEEVPNRSWRGTMTLPCQISLRRDEAGWMRLVQRPYGLDAFREPAIPFNTAWLSPQSSGTGRHFQK